MYDVAILGAGPAGICAAIYAARKKLKTVVITKDIGGQTLWSARVENYLGYQFIPGQELVKKFEEHLKEFAVDQEFSAATGIAKEGEFFVVATESSKEFKAKTVIIATGKAPRKLGVPGEDEFLGRGVTYCATCDAPLFSGMDVAVIGGGNAALEACEQLTRIAKKIYLISIGPWTADEITQEKIRKAKNVVPYVGYNTVEIKGKNMVEGIAVENSETKEKEDLEVQGVFIEIGSVPVTNFVKGFVELNDFGEVKINKVNETNVPGIFAAGDVTDIPDKQIIIAAGEGAKALLSAYKYLLTHRS